MQPLASRSHREGSIAQDASRLPRGATPSRRSVPASDGPDNAFRRAPSGAASARQDVPADERASTSTPPSASPATSDALDARRYPIDEATAAYITRFSRADESTSFHSVMQTVRLLDSEDRAPSIAGLARTGGDLPLSSLGTALLGLGRAVVARGDDRWAEQVTQMVQMAREQLPQDQQHPVIDALVKDAARMARSDRGFSQCMELAPRLPEPHDAQMLAASMQTWVHQYPRGSLYEHTPDTLLRNIRECRVAFEGLRHQAAGAPGAADGRDTQAEHAVLRALSEALPKQVLRGPQQLHLQQELDALIRLYGQTSPLRVDEQATRAEHPLTPALMSLQLPARADAVRELRRLIRRSPPPAQALMAQPLVETLLRPADYLRELGASLAWMKELAAPSAGVARTDLSTVANTMLHCSDYMLTEWPRLSSDHAQGFESFKNEVRAFRAQAKLDLMSGLGVEHIPPLPDVPLRFKSPAA